VPSQAPNKRRTEVADLHLTPGKLNAVRAALKANVPRRSHDSSPCRRPMCGRRSRAMCRRDRRTGPRPLPEAEPAGQGLIQSRRFQDGFHRLRYQSPTVIIAAPTPRIVMVAATFGPSSPILRRGLRLRMTDRRCILL
jgi:hypothetical protein